MEDNQAKTEVNVNVNVGDKNLKGQKIIIVAAIIAIIAAIAIIVTMNKYAGKYYRWEWSYANEEWTIKDEYYIELKSKKWNGSPKMTQENWGLIVSGDSYKVEDGYIYLNTQLLGISGVYDSGEFFGNGFKLSGYYYFKKGYTPKDKPSSYTSRE